MSKVKTPITSAPIAAIEAKPTSYMLRLPKETRERAGTYIVPKGPLGRERWLSKKSYAVSKDKEGLYVTLTQAQADYYIREGLSPSPIA